MTTFKSEKKKKSRQLAKEWTCSKPRRDITGLVFGRLTVLKYFGSKNHATYWLCDCKCGTQRIVKYGHLTGSQIVSCGCAKPTGKDHWKWSGYKEITGTYLHNWKTNAESRNVSIDVTEEQLWDQYINQKKLCALSGRPIGFEDNTASLDRIDSSLGYSKQNIQWLHKDVNRAKMDMSDSDFVKMCDEISTNFQTNKNKMKIDTNNFIQFHKLLTEKLCFFEAEKKYFQSKTCSTISIRYLFFNDNKENQWTNKYCVSLLMNTESEITEHFKYLTKSKEKNKDIQTLEFNTLDWIREKFNENFVDNYDLDNIQLHHGCSYKNVDHAKKLLKNQLETKEMLRFDFEYHFQSILTLAYCSISCPDLSKYGYTLKPINHVFENREIMDNRKFER